MGFRSDTDLIEGCLAGDARCFGALVGRYDGAVRGVLRREVAEESAREDLVQETFYLAFRQLEQLACAESFEHWLVRIARRRAAEHHRRQARRDAVRLRELARDVQDARGARAPTWIWEEVGRLDSKQAEVLRLRYVGGHSYEEIATRLGVPLSTVRGRVYEARKALRRRLCEEDGS